MSAEILAADSCQPERKIDVPDPDQPRISVCIVCRNEADSLEECLQSAAWADEILVMDLSSADASAEVARDSGARVVIREAVPFVEAIRNEIAALATCDWILVLDPDERVTPGLASELRRLSRRTNLDAVVIPRTNIDLGFVPSHPLHRYEPQLRMYRREKVEWPTVIHALPQVPEERLCRIPPCDNLVLLHDRSRSISEVLDRVRRYAPAQAQAMIDRGERFSGKRMLVVLASQSWTQFVVGQALRDGVPGFFRASILVAFHFYTWAMFWQLSGSQRSAQDDKLFRLLGSVAEGTRQVVRIARLPLILLQSLSGGRREAKGRDQDANK